MWAKNALAVTDINKFIKFIKKVLSYFKTVLSVKK